MAQEVQLTAGTLPPPACYATEQERFEAFVAATTVVISGGIQWEVGLIAPTDLQAYWLQIDSDGRPVAGLKWVTADGAWVRWFAGMVYGDDTGAADAYSITPLPVLTANTAYRVGMMYTFIANNANTGTAGVTFNVNGLGAKAIKKNVTEALALGDIKVDQVVTVFYDGVNFQIISKTSETVTHGAVPFYSGSGNWTVPSGVTSVVVECLGGGGGGDWGGAGIQGGGGGGYCRKRWTVVPGVLIPYVVGIAGIKTSSAGGAQNTNGGASYFNTTQIANGGIRGTGGGAGGTFDAACDYGFNGTSGARQAATDKWLGGQAAFPGSQGGWIALNMSVATDGVLGGGGVTDSDASGDQSSNGGAGCILITW